MLQIPSEWDRFVDEANARGIEPLLVLNYGNRFYDGGGRPTSPEAIAAFTRYAAFVAEHFKGRVAYYEIWNEWYLGTGWGIEGRGDAAAYIRLAKSVYPAIKEADPAATVLAGSVGTSGIRGDFLDQLIQQGILEHADALSLHPYIHCREDATPEQWAAWMRDVEERAAGLAGRPVPFYFTEMGWPSHTGACGISVDEQGEYLARMFLQARALPFVKGIWWYDLQNDGTDPTNQEHNFGLLNNDMTPKPAYAALKAISPLVREGRYVGGLDAGAADVWTQRFEQDGESVFALWRQAGASCTTVRLQSPTHETEVPLSGMPKLVSIPGASGTTEEFSATCSGWD